MTQLKLRCGLAQPQLVIICCHMFIKWVSFINNSKIIKIFLSIYQSLQSTFGNMEYLPNSAPALTSVGGWVGYMLIESSHPPIPTTHPDEFKYALSELSSEKKRCQSIWLYPKTVLEPYPNPKYSPIGPKMTKNDIETDNNWNQNRRKQAGAELGQVQPNWRWNSAKFWVTHI